MNRVACFHSASTTCKTLQTPRGSTRRCCSLPLTSPSRLAHTCIRCAAVPEEPSVSDALSKTTAVFQLAQGETPSLAKQRATLTRDLEEAVAREDYAAAALCRDQLKQLDASDPVARLKAALQVAIEEERFADAATLRDELKDALQSTTNLAEIPVSSDTVTHNIRVRVKSFYVPQQSSPARGLYFFAYSITITNEGEQTVILKNRHWLITDEEGQTEDVRGAGVVGAQPILNPGESFQYSSACPLRTPVGSMQGEYEFAVLDASGEWGDAFEVEIGRFGLNVEHKLSTFPRSFYVKVAAGSFLMGAAIETFMIHTGFYDIVTASQAEKLEATREEREEFLRSLHAELERQSREKGVSLKLPAPPPPPSTK